MKTGWGVPVIVIEGGQKPKVNGSSYYYETHSGDWIQLFYARSKRHIEVGSGWLIEYMPEVFAEMIAKRMIGR
jgi:hypothetical protein